MIAFMSRDWPASSVITTALKVPSLMSLQSTISPPPVVTRNTLPSSLASRIAAAAPVASPSQKSMMAQMSGFCCSMVVVTVREVVGSQFENGSATTLKSGFFFSTFMMPLYW